MDRKIKFRAWNKKKEIYIYFELDDMFTNKYDLFVGENRKDYIIQEFTGLIGCNSVEIYEGDIIDGWIVTYLGNSDEGLGMNAGWYVQKNDFDKWYELESKFDENYDNHKVDGNIFENKDLIEV